MSVSSMLLGGRYRLDQRLAAGGFGDVWQGADTLLDRRVAVKLLHPGFAQHPETLSRFRVEARHAGALCHQNIARVYDYGEPPAAPVPFLVMELVSGPSLAGLLRGGALAPGRVMDIVAQVAAGLDAAHRAGLVHRDIKPGNLLLGPDGVVKISDFGIAYAAGSAPLTMTGMIIGTPAYIAPERVSGCRAGPASDLYSLGVVAYECLAGAAPFAGMAQEMALAHQHRPLPPLPASVPTEVVALVADLTAKDPASRPASAGEVTRRAARLRDLPVGGRPGVPAGGAAVPAGGEARARGSDADQTLALRLSPPRRRLPGRRTAGRAATGLAAVAAAVTGLVLASLIGPAASDHPATVPSSAAAPSLPRSAALLRVDVDGSSLAGQPVSTVVSRLHRLGLVVEVLWRRSDQQPPGRVLSVQPGGQVPVGGRVTVTGALQLASSRQARGTSGPPTRAKLPAHPKPKARGPAKPKPRGPGKPKPPGPGKPKPPGPAKPPPGPAKPPGQANPNPPGPAGPSPPAP